MYKGRYVALVEYDFTFDDSAPNARPIEEIHKMFRDGNVEKELTQLLCDEAFDPRMGDCKVTQMYFTLYEQPKEECP